VAAVGSRPMAFQLRRPEGGGAGEGNMMAMGIRSALMDCDVLGGKGNRNQGGRF